MLHIRLNFRVHVNNAWYILEILPLPKRQYKCNNSGDLRIDEQLQAAVILCKFATASFFQVIPESWNQTET